MQQNGFLRGWSGLVDRKSLSFEHTVWQARPSRVMAYDPPAMRVKTSGEGSEGLVNRRQYRDVSAGNHQWSQFHDAVITACVRSISAFIPPTWHANVCASRSTALLYAARHLFPPRFYVYTSEGILATPPTPLPRRTRVRPIRTRPRPPLGRDTVTRDVAAYQKAAVTHDHPHLTTCTRSADILRCVPKLWIGSTLHQHHSLVYYQLQVTKQLWSEIIDRKLFPLVSPEDRLFGP